MKKFLTLAAILAGIIFAPLAAQAADPVDAGTYDWSGFYLGAVGTYGFANSHHCDFNCPDKPTPDSGPNVNGTGFGGGVTVGVNQTFNGFLFGAEGDYSITGINGSSPSQSVPRYGCESDCVTNVTSVGTARLRLGMPINNVLPYLTGGLAFSNVHGELGGIGADTSFLNAVVGAGVEVGLSANVSIKGEYLHIFDNGQTFLFRPDDCAAPGCSLNHYSNNLVRLGLNVRF